ncbi:MAG TPA: hypothetical protein VLH15_04870, partial [Dehalococcoidales bacterium]|nr:hypothetical protein [Dehalococcoidales bacterium]
MRPLIKWTTKDRGSKMPDRFHSDSGERVDYSVYSPGLVNSGNRISTTWTISATSEGSSTDTVPMTLPAPADKRFDILRIGTRSSLTVDSFNAGCTQLRCRIYVDTQHANNLLHDITIAAPGNTLTTQDCFSTTKATIYNLLKDGLAHNFIFYFWVNAGDAVLSVAQVWEGVGTSLAQSSPMA